MTDRNEFQMPTDAEMQRYIDGAKIMRAHALRDGVLHLIAALRGLFASAPQAARQH